MTNWPAYLLVPALVVHYGWYEKNNRIINPFVLGVTLFSLAMLCLFGFFLSLRSTEYRKCGLPRYNLHGIDWHG